MDLAGVGLRNPIVTKETRSQMRTWRAPVTISLYLVLLAGFGYAMFSVAVLGAPFNRPTASQISAAVYDWMAFQLLLMLLFAPALAAGGISGERERQTFDLLLTSELSAFEIVLGKLVASMAYLVLLVFAALPLFAVVFLFAGVDLQQFLLAQLLTLLTALAAGSVALLWSALLGRTQAATLMAFGTVLVLYIGTALIGIIPSYTAAIGNGAGPQTGSPDVHPLYFGNPFYAMNVVLTHPSGAGLHLGRLLQLLLPSDSAASAWGPVVEPWQVATVAQVLLTVVAVTVTVRVLRRPNRRLPFRFKGAHR